MRCLSLPPATFFSVVAPMAACFYGKPKNGSASLLCRATRAKCPLWLAIPQALLQYQAAATAHYAYGTSQLSSASTRRRLSALLTVRVALAWQGATMASSVCDGVGKMGQATQSRAPAFANCLRRRVTNLSLLSLTAKPSQTATSRHQDSWSQAATTAASGCGTAGR